MKQQAAAGRSVKQQAAHRDEELVGGAAENRGQEELQVEGHDAEEVDPPVRRGRWGGKWWGGPERRRGWGWG